MAVDKFFEISEDLKLGADRYQYILYKKRIVSDEKSKNFGKEEWDQEAYFSKIKDVVRYLAENKLKEHLDDLYVILDWINDIESKFSVLDDAARYRRSLR